MEIKQDVLYGPNDCKPFNLGEASGRTGGGSTEGAKDPNKSGGSSLAPHLKKMLGM